jgi:hypothetical protein
MIERLAKTIWTVPLFFCVVNTSWAATYSYEFDLSSYEVSLGGTVDVSVYLRETGGTVFHGSGLIGAGVKVRFDNPPVPSNPAKIMTTSDVTNISNFELEWSKSAKPESGYADLLLGTWNYVYGIEAAPGVYRIPLGKFRFSAGTVLGQVTNIRATDYDLSSADVVYYDNELNPVELDGLLANATATITVIPEPGTLSLLLIAGLSLSGSTWCRRK